MIKRKRKKKILFVLHLPPPVHGSSIVGKYIKESTLINNRFNSKYINLGTSKSIDEIGKKFSVKFFIYFKIILQVVKQLLIFKPDLVYLAMTAKGLGFYKDIMIVFFIKLFRKQLVIHFHNKGVSDNQHRALDNFLYKRIFKNTKVILLSKYLYYDVEKYVNEKNIYYCPNGIPNVSSEVIEPSVKNDFVHILFLSNLIISKGAMVLLKALSILKNTGANFKCNFVGGIGDISESLFLDTIKRLGLEAEVKYLGEKFDSKKSSVFLNSDIFVHPTFNDCFPLVILEAMQFQLPVISTNIGAIPSIINDLETGFIVEKGNPIKLAKKIEWLINNPTKANEMGILGRKKFENEYTLENFERNFTSVLNKIYNNIINVNDKVSQ